MQKGCLIVGIGCLSVVVLVVTVAGIAFVWAAASARRLGDPRPERVSETVIRSSRVPRVPSAAEPDEIIGNLTVAA